MLSPAKGSAARRDIDAAGGCGDPRAGRGTRIEYLAATTLACRTTARRRPAPPLQLVLFVESALMLSAGCLTGAVAGIYGQVVIDGYLEHVTGFPVADVATGGRPIEISVLVIAAFF